MEDLTRPDWGLYFMRMAYVVAQRGSCRRRRVGCVLVEEGTHDVIATGYNSSPRGAPTCLTEGCDLREVEGRMSCQRIVHAEQRAIMAAYCRVYGSRLYTTTIPCRDCAKHIVHCGRIAVVAYHQYYESNGTKEVEEMFRKADIKLLHLDYTDSMVMPTYFNPKLAEENKP